MYLKERIEEHLDVPIKLTPGGELVMKAAGLIRKYGTAKGTMEDERGGLCIYGALYKAMTGNAWMGPDSEHSLSTFHEAERMIATRLGVPEGNSICLWNNAPERTADEIVTMMEQAAKVVVQ